MDLRGKVALVTGASSGIGRAVAVRLADAGARVVVHGRDRERTTEVASTVKGVPLLADLAAPGAPDRVVAEALASHGRIDVLVANAGFGWSGPFVEMDLGRLDEMVAVDLTAPLRLARGVLPGMVERGSGHLALVGSVAGRTGVAGEAVYAACKAGLDGFAECLRLELADSGVGVSVVVPAAVRTSFFGRRGRPYDRRLPRPVSADSVARATVTAIRRGQPEVWVPAWVRVAPTVRALAPSGFRRLAARYGEPVRATRTDPDRPGRTGRPS